jgi:hypothetical protein
MTPNEEIAALILPWAKANEPEKYQATLAVAQNARTFRRYMIRLIEIRWQQDPADWIKSVPLSVLEDSGVVMRLRWGEHILEVKGRLAPPPRIWGFAELVVLTSNKESMQLMVDIKNTLDLELVSVGPAESLPPPLVLDRGKDLWHSPSHAT